ncbi:MAG: hypothetical protein D6728_17315 [Cyanobacteria bacterium J055]|nr:MAG: hypothetical protein D6728_17315 [Cyanobacteria bacterium J055]
MRSKNKRNTCRSLLQKTWAISLGFKPQAGGGNKSESQLKRSVKLASRLELKFQANKPNSIKMD